MKFFKDSVSVTVNTQAGFVELCFMEWDKTLGKPIPDPHSIILPIAVAKDMASLVQRLGPQPAAPDAAALHEAPLVAAPSPVCGQCSVQ